MGFDFTTPDHHISAPLPGLNVLPDDDVVQLHLGLADVLGEDRDDQTEVSLVIQPTGPDWKISQHGGVRG